MKAYHYRFEQVMTIREQEKTESEIAFKESVNDFEEKATKLFNLLKKKENLIDFQQERMSTGSSINEIHHYSRFIGSLEKSISAAQQEVILARSTMQWHEEKLREKTLEFRKFEKMKEKDLQAYKEEQNRLETKQLDELSSVAYYNNEIR